MTQDTTGSVTNQTKSPRDRKREWERLRGWAQKIQVQNRSHRERIEILEAASASQSSRIADLLERMHDQAIRSFGIPPFYLNLRARPLYPLKFHERRMKLREVQIWTSAGQNEDGETLLCSLDWPEPIRAGEVYLATHDIDNLEPYDEWLTKVLSAEDEAED